MCVHVSACEYTALYKKTILYTRTHNCITCVLIYIYTNIPAFPICGEFIAHIHVHAHAHNVRINLSACVCVCGMPDVPLAYIYIYIYI